MLLDMIDGARKIRQRRHTAVCARPGSATDSGRDRVGKALSWVIGKYVRFGYHDTRWRKYL
jgi:hypothetical protein